MLGLLAMFRNIQFLAFARAIYAGSIKYLDL